MPFARALQLLPWSLAFVVFIFFTGIVHASLSNGYLAQAYVTITAVGTLILIALFGHRYNRCLQVIAASLAVMAMQIWGCVGSLFPSKYVAVHVLLWAVAFAIYAKLTPVSFSSVKAQQSASTPSPDADKYVDTFGFVCAVNSAVIALFALVFVFPSYFPVLFTDLFTHAVVK